MSNIEDILQPQKLDITRTIKGKTRAEDYVYVYRDQAAIYELFKANTEMEQIAQNTERSEEVQARYDELEEKVEALVSEVEASRVAVHLRGLYEYEIKKILDATKQPDIEDATERAEQEAYAFNNEMFKKALVKLVYADESEETDVDPVTFREEIDREWSHIIGLMEALNFAQSYFDEAVDAGFLQRH